MSTALQHVVEAYNLSAASENKIHDDSVAKKFGFEGGLVPGVEVYAYMTHLAVARFGIDWLRHGNADCRFHKPVYDGRDAEVGGTARDDDSIAIKVESDGILCATGQAGMDEAAAAPSIDEIPAAPLPDHATRPDASPESIVAGQLLGTYEIAHGADENAQYVADVRETLDLYEAENLLHPGLVLRLANRALAKNVRLGPWIHVGSALRNFSAARTGDRLAARARVLKEYEHKGHRFVEMDVLVTANDAACVTRIHHTAIYRPRQVGGG